MRRIALVAALATVLLAGTAHADPFLDTERTECEQTAVALQREFRGTGLLTADILCRKVDPNDQKVGIYDDGYVFVLYGNGDRTPQEYRDIAIHELGHAWQDLRLTDARWARYLQVRGLANGVPALEDYADVFAFLMAGVTRNAYGTRLPNVIEAAVICKERMVPCWRRPTAAPPARSRETPR